MAMAAQSPASISMREFAPCPPPSSCPPPLPVGAAVKAVRSQRSSQPLRGVPGSSVARISAGNLWGPKSLPPMQISQKPAAPVFQMKSGTYDGQVVVGIEAKGQGLLHYSVENLAATLGALAASDCTTSTLSPTLHGHVYRKPFVLDQPGIYLVQAVFQVDEWGLDRSEIVSATYRIHPEAPRILTEAGTYQEKVMVHIASKPEFDVHYTVVRLSQDNDAAKVPKPTDSNYEGEILLDQPGEYIVRAACFVGTISSSVVSAAFTVKTQSFGQRLKALPGAMVQGLISIAGSTQSTLAPKVESMRSAIARAAGAMTSQVSLDISSVQGQGAEVKFCVESERAADAESVAAKVVDPSLVEHVARVANVSIEQIQVKAHARSLDEVLLSLEWTCPNGSRDYLDGSCLVYAGGELLEVVDYRGPESVKRHRCSSATYDWSAGTGENAVITHSGDVNTSTGGSHAIRLRMNELPATATDCFFVLSAYNCQNISLFRDPCMKLFDAENPSHMISNYDIADAGTNAAVIVCALSREKDVWAVRAFGETCHGTVRSYAPIETAIAPFQEKHRRWKRRRQFILIHSLWHADRALPRGALQQREDVLIPTMELPDQLFRSVMKFI
eukprot:TRINITY_DN93534_c0_g1_i1.p1 TRINITY_DN93534_c0_g1~~TRINITY_DN93534_c0_g1_i1.p1  ORF type:complete len:615 (-),score=97.10 TRINITY_DN93534_c0_g1_i1:689-2533(-)